MLDILIAIHMTKFLTLASFSHRFILCYSLSKANTGDELILRVKVKFRLYMLFSSRWYQYNDYPSYDFQLSIVCEQTLELFNTLHAEIIYTSPFINTEIKIISLRSK